MYALMTTTESTRPDDTKYHPHIAGAMDKSGKLPILLRVLVKLLLRNHRKLQPPPAEWHVPNTFSKPVGQIALSAQN